MITDFYDHWFLSEVVYGDHLLVNTKITMERSIIFTYFYWKKKLTISIAMFHSYVELPEGISGSSTLSLSPCWTNLRVMIQSMLNDVEMFTYLINDFNIEYGKYFNIIQQSMLNIQCWMFTYWRNVDITRWTPVERQPISVTCNQVTNALAQLGLQESWSMVSKKFFFGTKTCSSFSDTC